ncbi:MAG: hypothetical protein Q8K86_07000 [Candidatus Nanopelagicaceae bacterium]|nr:hypothetical protein [Candidatus Nanopelagicaceae bacterium]
MDVKREIITEVWKALRCAFPQAEIIPVMLDPKLNVYFSRAMVSIWLNGDKLYFCRQMKDEPRIGAHGLALTWFDLTDPTVDPIARAVEYVAEVTKETT